MDFDDIIRLETKDIVRLIASHMKWAVKVIKKKKKNCWTCVKKYNRSHVCLHHYYRFDCLLRALYFMLWLQTWKIICVYTLFFSTPMQPHIIGYLAVCLIYKFPLMHYIHHVHIYNYSNHIIFPQSFKSVWSTTAIFFFFGTAIAELIDNAFDEVGSFLLSFEQL